MTDNAIDQLDLFVANIIDVAPKGETRSMDYPIFAISAKPDMDKFRHENKQTGSWIEVIPSGDGRATIHDKDLIIYILGQIVGANEAGRQTSRRVSINAYDYLTITHRGTDGKAYRSITDSLARLRGTSIRSNIVSETNQLSKKAEVFGLIDSARAVTDDKGRLQYIEVVISEHLFQAATKGALHEYNRDYFRLRAPYDRRLYELCKRYCGKGTGVKVPLEELWHIFGVKSPLKEFRRKIKSSIERQVLPDYHLEYEPPEVQKGPDYVIMSYGKETFLEHSGPKE